MYKDRSNVEPAPVSIASVDEWTTEVWLHDNVSYVESEEGNYWEADYVHGIVVGKPTVEQIAEDYDYWWEKLEQMEINDHARISKLEAQVLYTAVMTDTYMEE